MDHRVLVRTDVEPRRHMCTQLRHMDHATPWESSVLPSISDPEAGVADSFPARHGEPLCDAVFLSTNT